MIFMSLNVSCILATIKRIHNYFHNIEKAMNSKLKYMHCNLWLPKMQYAQGTKELLIYPTHPNAKKSTQFTCVWVYVQKTRAIHAVNLTRIKVSMNEEQAINCLKRESFCGKKLTTYSSWNSNPRTPGFLTMWYSAGTRVSGICDVTS